MNYITTTDLRTKSKDLIRILREGRSVDLIHRSKVVGEIRPKIYEPKPFGAQLKTINAKSLAKKIDKLNLPILTFKEIDRRYRVSMMKKHGKGLSRR